MLGYLRNAIACVFDFYFEIILRARAYNIASMNMLSGMKQDRGKIARIPNVRRFVVYMTTFRNKSVCTRFRHTMPRTAFAQG